MIRSHKLAQTLDQSESSTWTPVHSIPHTTRLDSINIRVAGLPHPHPETRDLWAPMGMRGMLS